MKSTSNESRGKSNARHSSTALKTNHFSHYFKALLLSVLFVTLAELFIFNYPYWESRYFSNQTNASFTLGKGMIRENGFILASGESDSYIEIDCRGIHVDNLHLELTPPDNPKWTIRNTVGTIYPIRLSITDSANSEFLELPEIDYCQWLEGTHFMRVHLVGQSELIRIGFREGAIFRDASVTLNEQRPFDVSIFRVGLLLLLTLIYQMFKPSSALYSTYIDDDSIISNVTVGFFAAILACSILVLSQLTGTNHAADVENITTNGKIGYIVDMNHYNYLADSIIEQKPYLDLEVSDTMLDLDNPYDRNARMKALYENEDFAYMDYAFYKGHYYCYFGVVPALLAFVPYKLATGVDLRTDFVVGTVGFLTVFSLLHLMRAIGRKYQIRVSLGSFLLSSLSIVAGCGLFTLVFLPTTYSVPVLFSLFFGSMGLSVWLDAHRNESLSRPHLLIGSFLVALTIGCRPSFVLLCLAAFPIFWKEIRYERAFFAFDKDALVNTSLVIGPFLMVAAPLMWYNLIRFGSVFDFGATYNITGMDMTHRAFSPIRIIEYAFEFIFQPLNFSLKYPFINAVDMSVDYQGLWFYETYLGGLLSFSPICISTLFVRSINSKEKGRSLSFVLLSIAAIMILLDSHVASITQRYFGDFAWLILVVSWLIVWNHWEELGQTNQGNCIKTGVVALALIGVALSSWSLLSTDRYAALIRTCPTVYYTIKMWLSFLQ